AEERIAEARMAAGDGGERELRPGEAVREGNEMLASVAKLWPVAVVPITESVSATTALAHSNPGGSRGPVRNPSNVGPLNVYYYNYLADVLGAEADPGPLATREGGVLVYESFNLVDGRLTVSEIRGILSGRYAPVPLAEVSDYLNLLAKAKVISWK